MIAKKMRHLFGAFQMSLGMSLKFFTDGFNCFMFANTGEDILHATTVGMVIKRIIQSDERNFIPLRQCSECLKSCFVTSAIKRRRPEPEMVGCLRDDTVQGAFCFIADFFRRHQNEIKPLARIEKIIERKQALAFLGAAFAKREEARQAPIGRAIFRIDKKIRRAVSKDEAATNREF